MNNYQKLLTEIYEDLKEEIYGSELIVDVGNVKKRKDELLSLDEYLPNLLRPYLGMDYSSKLMDSPNKDYIDKIGGFERLAEWGLY